MRCKACNTIMKRCDYESFDPDIPEEEVCASCRQEVYKYSDDNITLGFSEEERADMEAGFYVDYRGGRFDE